MTCRILMTLLCIVVLVPALARADQQQIILNEGDRERIKLAKDRLAELKKSLEEAKEIEDKAKEVGWIGDDDGIGDSLANGIKTIDFANEMIDKGLATANFIDTVIRWHTAVSCLSQATDCMTRDRNAACVRSYAYGMSQFFMLAYEALGGGEDPYKDLEWKELITSASKARAFLISQLTRHYVEALKVAAETYQKADMWGQICKTEQTCDEICTVPENVTLFDCPELQSTNMSQPMCVNLKNLMEGQAEQKSIEQLIVIEHDRRFRITHSQKINFDGSKSTPLNQKAILFDDLNSVRFQGTSASFKSKKRSQLSRADVKLRNAVDDFESFYPQYWDAIRNEDLDQVDQLSPAMKRASCDVQKQTSFIYQVCFNAYANSRRPPRPGNSPCAHQQYLKLLSATNAIAVCADHEQYRREVEMRAYRYAND